MPKTLLIINPNADMGNAWRKVRDLRPLAEASGQEITWAGTVYPTHAVELARQAADQGFERVVAIGGDGTVHEVVNGLMQVPAERRPALGVVPFGSGNDFAYGVGLPTDPAQALQRALNGQPRAIDIGLVEDNLGRREYWDNTLGIGFDAVVTIRSHNLPVVRGFLMYLVAVLQTIALNHEAAHMTLEADGQTWETDLLMLVACNGPREGGGFLIAPEAKPDDGVFHYAAFEEVSRLTMLRLLPMVMQGTHPQFPTVRLGTFRRLHLRSDRPLRIHLDGEIFAGFGTDVRELTLSLLPQALRVMV